MKIVSCVESRTEETEARVSLKGVDYGDVHEATQNTVRQVVTIKVGISSEKAKEINKLIKSDGPKGVNSQTQGTVRVTGKGRSPECDCDVEGRRHRHPIAIQQLPRLNALDVSLQTELQRPVAATRRRRWRQPTLLYHRGFDLGDVSQQPAHDLS